MTRHEENGGHRNPDRSYQVSTIENIYIRILVAASETERVACLQLQEER